MQILDDINALSYQDFCRKYGADNPSILGKESKQQYGKMKMMLKILKMFPKKREEVIQTMMSDKRWNNIK